MPYITLECGKLTKVQKEQLITEMTCTASEITHIPPQFFVMTIKELPDDSIGVGGETIEKTKAAYQKQQSDASCR